MSRRLRSSSPPELEPLLQHGRALQRLPEAVRARALERAGKAAAFPGALSHKPIDVVRQPLPLARLAVAVPLSVIAVGVAGFALSVAWSSHSKLPPASSSQATASVSVVKAAPDARAPTVSSEASGPASPDSGPAGEAVRPAEPPPHGTPPPVSEHAGEAEASELELLRRAHAAYARRDYSNVLGLVARHARRFPNGVLAEEREALRVQALLGAGREGEARSAAAGFVARFPRSVLLSQMRKLSAPSQQ